MYICILGIGVVDIGTYPLKKTKSFAHKPIHLPLKLRIITPKAYKVSILLLSSFQNFSYFFPPFDFNVLGLYIQLINAGYYHLDPLEYF